MTITEALQEIKTILKRIEKKREFINGYLWRQNHLRDPHEKSGGSRDFISKERQAIKDLENNIIDIKQRISKANDSTQVTVCGETKTISEWLIWRREIAKPRKYFLESIYSKVQSARAQAVRNNITISGSDVNASAMDLIINIDEKEVSQEVEKIVETLSTLDGQLSMKNSTVKI